MFENQTPLCGRFAPSPTGRMHLGNIYAALLSWLAVKSEGGRWILRIEDLDPQRSKIEYSSQIEDDLLWLGLDWDEGGSCGGICAPYFQSKRADLYQVYFDNLQQQNLVYPCFCRRADLLASQAPHATDRTFVYNGTCRRLSPREQKRKLQERKPAIRLIVPDEEISFVDGHYGTQTFNLSKDCGDFIIRRADDTMSYQLAVVVDDALMGITQVVRGNDLLLSSPQQIYLYRLLGLREPRFFHIPLLCSSNGARLCKRDKSLDMETLRKHFTAEQIIGRLAFYAGLIDTCEPISAKELLPIFCWNKIPKNNIIVNDIQ